MWQQIKETAKSGPSRTMRLVLSGWVSGVGTAVIIGTWLDSDITWMWWQRLLVTCMWILGITMSFRNLPSEKAA